MGEEGNRVEADEVDERSAVRTMCECGSVTTQLPLCVSHTLLRDEGGN